MEHVPTPAHDPDATTTDVATPNADFLYSQAWLDLSKGPVVLTVPDTKGRYYLLALLDGYTNVVSSIGKRTTGTEKRQFAIVGPGYKGAIPEGTSEVRSPTNLAWIFGRTAVEDKADVANAAKIQDQYKLSGPATKSAPSAKGAPAPKSATPPSAEGKSPRDQVAAMNAATFFARVAMLLPENPPSKDDAAILEKFKAIGLTPGKPFDASKLDPAMAKALDDGVQAAIQAVSSAAGGLAGADIRNGWRIDRALGRWGNDYGRRALAAWNGIGLNAPEDAIFMSTDLGAGKKLDGANRYVLHFDAKQLPPTEGFWSVSLYDDKHRFVANPLNRYNIGSTDRLKTNPDGSLDIVISQANPGGDANWLPAPKGPFSVILRIYWPKQEVIDAHSESAGDPPRGVLMRFPDLLATRRPAVSRVLPALHHRGHPARLHGHGHRHADAPPGTRAGRDRRVRRLALPAVGVQVGRSGPFVDTFSSDRFGRRRALDPR